MAVDAPLVNPYGKKVSYSWPGVFSSFLAGLYATQTHADAVITINADSARPNILGHIDYSYSGGTPAGSLTVKDGSTTVFSIDIVAAGPGKVVFDPPLAGTSSTALTITLLDGGSSIVGKVNANAWREQ